MKNEVWVYVLFNEVDAALIFLPGPPFSCQEKGGNAFANGIATKK